MPQGKDIRDEEMVAIFWWSIEDESLRRQIREDALDWNGTIDLDETLVGFKVASVARAFRGYLKKKAKVDERFSVAGIVWVDNSLLSGVERFIDQR
jgi:hypothetical protein